MKNEEDLRPGSLVSWMNEGSNRVCLGTLQRPYGRERWVVRVDDGDNSGTNLVWEKALRRTVFCEHCHKAIWKMVGWIHVSSMERNCESDRVAEPAASRVKDSYTHQKATFSMGRSAFVLEDGTLLHKDDEVQLTGPDYSFLTTVASFSTEVLCVRPGPNQDYKTLDSIVRSGIKVTKVVPQFKIGDLVKLTGPDDYSYTTTVNDRYHSRKGMIPTVNTSPRSLQAPIESLAARGIKIEKIS